MSIKYICPYCKTTLGVFDSTHVSEAQLGLHSLTPEERNHIISYEANGDVVASVTCEYCSEAIDRNPELANPLH